MIKIYNYYTIYNIQILIINIQIITIIYFLQIYESKLTNLNNLKLTYFINLFIF